VRFRGRWAAKGAAFIVCGLAFVALLSWIVMSLWNAVVVDLFRIPMLDFWHAVGLLVLCKILFGGFRRGGGWHGHRRWRGEMWRRKWESMTPEERERMRAKFAKHRCGWYGGPPSDDAMSKKSETPPL
jgi:Ca2+/H+ antiporter, TMEM165/GDT1 family